MKLRNLTVLYLVALGCLAQTRLNLGSASPQTGSPNFSAMTHTKPAQVGSSLPGSCDIGDLFLSTTAAAGQNLYACVGSASPGTWSVVGSGASSGSGSGSGSGTISAATLGGAMLVADTGAVNAYAGCPTPALSSTPVDGSIVSLKASVANTGPSTFALCGGTPAVIANPGGGTLLAGEIQPYGTGSPSVALLQYGTAAGQWLLLTPAQMPILPQSYLTQYRSLRSNGSALTFARPLDPGDGRRGVLVTADGSAAVPCGGGALSAGTATAHCNGLASRWITSSGALSAVAPNGSNLAALRQTTGAASTDYSAVDNGSNYVLRTARNLYLDTTVAFAASPSRAWVALSLDDGPALRTQDSPAHSVIGLRYSPAAGDQGWTCVVSAGGSAITTVPSGVTFDANQHRYEIRVDDAGFAIHFLMDGTEVCANTPLTNIPAGVNLQSVIVVTGASNQIDFAYVYAESDK